MPNFHKCSVSIAVITVRAPYLGYPALFFFRQCRMQKTNDDGEIDINYLGNAILIFALFIILMFKIL